MKWPGVAFAGGKRLGRARMRPGLQVDKARSRQAGGTGLGLAIVKHIVENRGGSVRVKSAPGQGAEFLVTLPRPRHSSIGGGA